MGIPSYFADIIKTYGNRFFVKSRNVTRLFLDLNCCIYGCKHRIEKEFGNIKIDNSTFENKIIQEVLQTIVRLSQECNLSSNGELFIMIDGSVPLAKMTQQRERRHKAVKLKERTKEILERYEKELPYNWDSNAITPGTQFMDKLSDQINKNIRQQMVENGFMNIKITLNDVRSPGEGEQKIFSQLRKHPNGNMNQMDVIYGLDADLIMLSMLQIANKNQKAEIILLREKQHFGKLVQNEMGLDELVLFNATDFIKCVYERWSQKSKSITTTIYEQVLLCFLMGNDFVPHTPSLKIGRDGIDKLLEIYHRNSESLFVENNQEKINWKTMKNILKGLEVSEWSDLKSEQKRYNAITEKIRNGQTPYRQKNTTDPCDLEIESLDWEHLYHPCKINVFQPNWKSEQQQGLFGFVPDEKDVNKCINQQLRSIEWCWRQQLGLNVPFREYQPYPEGPLLSEIVRQLERSDKLSFNWERDEPIPEYIQLLLVLPLESSQLISTKYEKVFNFIQDLYPIETRVWKFMKLHAWECRSIQPELDPTRIEEICKVIVKGDE